MAVLVEAQGEMLDNIEAQVIISWLYARSAGACWLLAASCNHSLACSTLHMRRL